MSKLTNYKEQTSTRFFSIETPAEKKVLIGTLIGLILFSIIATFVVMNAPDPKEKFTGNVTVTSKTVRGYACSIRYVQEDGKEDGFWLGKPGNSVCKPINMGPAKMVDGVFVKGTLTD